jgi:MarR family transcriptional regulator for hemolysin
LVRSKQSDTQSRLAEAIRVTGATLTHHLNALEDKGLIHGWRERSNRRVQRVELTGDGVAMFDRLRAVAVAHDGRLRASFTDQELAQLADGLDRLRAAVATPVPAVPA